MTPAQFQRVEELFHRFRHVPPQERDALLDQGCPDDPEVREEAKKLLACADPEKSLTDLRERLNRALRGTAPDAGRTTIVKFTEPAPAPTQIGHYRIIGKIGEGGMGAVYEARQEKPDRTVALKIMNARFASDRMRFRFEHEVEVLGRLQHPGIAQIFEGGTFDPGSGPQPFFAMELIKGKPLTAWAEQHKLGTRQRLELMSKVCDAVEHAHQKGVIHRDLKPGNILVDESGQPKTLDFGVARATDSDLQSTTLRTDVGQIVGTVPYMSPEQAGGQADELDTRSDVYALGVVTYELLTGSLPYDLRDQPVHEALRIVRETDPTPLSSITGGGTGVPPVDRDVETIVAKALEKDKARRYRSASDLAGDMRRYLRDEPIEARPPSAAYHLRKFAKRHKALVGGVAAVFVVLVAGIIGTGTALAREAEQRRLAVAAEQEQNRARQEAEQAQAAEVAQRKLAEQREQEATEARDRLQIVADFQSSMLGETDAEGMGLAIVDGFEDRIRPALAERIEDQGELDRVMHEWRQRTLKAGPTTVALGVLDEFVLGKAAETIEKDFADQPLVRAALQQTVANTYLDIGLHEPAVPLQEAALATCRQELGDDHPRTLASINSMGVLLNEMGSSEEAKPYNREALETYRRVLGDDHPDTLESINDMGLLLQSMGKYVEAEPYYREALDGRRRVLGDDHQGTLTSINNMGYLLEAMGKYAEAEPYHQEALNGNRRVLGDDHPKTLTSINNMGYLLKSMGKYAEAEPYYQEALEGCRRVLGDEHPETLKSINNLGAVLLRIGKLSEAEPYFREALEGNRRVLGDVHPDTLTSIHNMGLLLKSIGKLSEAELYLRQALEGRRRFLGDDHPNTLQSINTMGFLLGSMGKLSEAEPYVRKALAACRRVLGDEHLDTLISIHNMGTLLRDLGRLEEAEALGAEAVRGARAKLAPSHVFLLAALAQHGRTLAAMQRFTEAEAELLEAYEGCVETLGPGDRRTKDTAEALVDLYAAWHEAQPDMGHDAKAAVWRAKLPAPERAGSLIKLGMRLLEDGRHAEAEAALGECLEIRQEALPEGHWLIFNTMSVLGDCLAGQGADRSLTVARRIEKLREAEPLLLEGYEGLTAAAETIPQTTRDQRLQEAQERIVKLYDAWHAAEPDAGYDAKAAAWRAKLPEENGE